jgi:hypothetical protein
LRRITNSALTLILVCGIAAVLSRATGAEEGFSTANILTYLQQYSRSNHANNGLANEVNEDALKDPDDAACLKCHATQGFLQWATGGFDPKFKKFTALKKGSAQGANCLTCHDPMAKTTGPSDDMLRIAGATPMLDAGFKVDDAGKGAVCMICHNSRRGLYSDKVRPRMSHRAPHETSNTDLLMGQNFYFIEAGKPSVHAAVPDTCVGCHMKAVDKAGKITDHSLKDTWQNCTECHDKLDGAALKKEIMAGVEKMKDSYDKALATMIQKALDGGGFQLLDMAEDETVDKEWTGFKSGKLTELKGRYFHGGQAFDMKIDGKKYLVYIHNMKLQGTSVIDTAEGQVIAKAGWNYYMFSHDRSNGAHAPDLYEKVVVATMKQLQSVDLSKVTVLPKEEKK